jgi:hypothetical protein
MGMKKELMKKLKDTDIQGGMEQFISALADLNKNQMKLEKNMLTIQKNQVEQEKYLIAICEKLGIEDVE